VPGHCRRRVQGQGEGRQAKSRFFWNFVPIKFRTDARAPWKVEKPEVRPAIVSWSVWDGIMNQYGNEGNVSDPDKAIYLGHARGHQKTNTEYTVGLDTETVRTPANLDDAVRAMIAEALSPAGPTCTRSSPAW
jgi:hypothetical protein